MFQNGFNHEILECNNNNFLKIPLRSYLPQKANQLMFLRLLSLQAHSREFIRVLSLLLSNIFLWCCVLFVCVCDLFI